MSGMPLEDIIKVSGIDLQKVQGVMDEAKKGGTHFVNETGQSASAGPARAACDMLRPMIQGESEVQPVIAILENEYGLLKKEDRLDSMSFGVPAKIGPYGVEKIYELPVQDIRSQLERSAAIIKEDIKGAAGILKDQYGLS